MGKPVYKSKKFWTAVVTSIAIVVVYVNGDEQLAALITAIGSVRSAPRSSPNTRPSR